MNTTVTPSNDHLPSYRHPDTVVGAKKALEPREVWSIRARLQMTGATRNLALFSLAIDSKLRGCDLVTLRVSDIAAPPRIRDRAIVIQHKTGRPVQFEITRQTQDSLREWFAKRHLRSADYVFPSRNRPGAHLSTRQYGRILKQWVAGIGLDPADYGTHTMRRTKAAQIYKETGNLRAVHNLHADILSDLAAALAGSIGIGATANLNPKREFPSMFERMHGSAFDNTGKGIANPVGTFWTAQMMLQHLGEHAASERLMNAIQAVTADPSLHTPGLGGRATTRAVTDGLIKIIRTQPGRPETRNVR